MGVVGSIGSRGVAPCPQNNASVFPLGNSSTSSGNLEDHEAKLRIVEWPMERGADVAQRPTYDVTLENFHARAASGEDLAEGPRNDILDVDAQATPGVGESGTMRSPEDDVTSRETLRILADDVDLLARPSPRCWRQRSEHLNRTPGRALGHARAARGDLENNC
jgi:hypothetical protein